ncbi:MAG: uroporphyrinogen decarboxylase [Magnetovibrio sp.]|nr:uroporphyrinogen decarboxylase [Magnetovibrio sp.]
MTSSKPFLRALAGDTVRPAPVWMMRQAGRYLPEYRELRIQAANFVDFCFTPSMAIEATLQPLRRYAMNAAILFSDILVIPHGLGQDVAFREGEGPVLDAITDAAGIEALQPGAVNERLAPVFETVRGVKAALDEKTALIGFAGAPFTVALYMIEGRGGTEGTKIRRWAAEAPDEFGRLIDILSEATTAYLIEQIENGAEALQLFDSWAGLLPESMFRRWVIAPNRRIVEAVKAAHPNIPIIGFPRNAGVLYRDFAVETGVDGVSIDATVPLEWAAETLQPICTVQGNLDNHVLLSGGETLEAEVGRILDAFGNGRFVFNLGHGVLPPTPPEHVGRVVDLIRARA